MLLYEDHTSVVYALAFSPDGSTLASGAKDGRLYLHDADGTARLLSDPGPKPPPVHAIAYLPDGRLVVGHAHGWHLYRRDADGWKDCPPFATPTTSLAVLNATTLAIGTGDRLKATAGTFELWDLTAGRRIDPYFTEPNGVKAVAACPAKGLVAWATGHMKVSIWDHRTQSPYYFMQKKNCPALALAPDGAALAAAVDYTVRLYDLDRRREKAELKGHKGMVWAVAFSPDAATIATGSWDGTVRLWDATSGREKAVYKWPVGKVCSLAYAPDGLRLAAGGDSGTVVVWTRNDHVHLIRAVSDPLDQATPNAW